jgi:hypothetical protein
LGTATLSPSLDGMDGSASAQATFTTSGLTLGSHSLTAVYNGANLFDASTSTVLSQTVQQDSTTTSLSSSASAAQIGQSLTFTATVTPASSGMPTGTVTFENGTTVLGVAIVAATSSGAQASFTTSALAIGSYSVTAVYSGDNSFTGSTSVALMQTVGQESTTITLSSSAPTATSGQSLTFTATVTGADGGTPTGSVTFMDGTTVLGTAMLSAASSGAQATFTTSTLANGAQTITAVYSGDSTYAASTSAVLNQTVSTSSSVSSATSLSASALQAAPGQTVTFTATVTGADGGTPTGTVTFEDGGTVLGTATLSAASSGAQASFSTSALDDGTQSITAVYSGDSNYAASTSLAVSVTIQANASSSSTSTASMTPSLASSGGNVSTSASANVAMLSNTDTAALNSVTAQLTAVATSGGAVMASSTATSAATSAVTSGSSPNAATPPQGPLYTNASSLTITSGTFYKHYTEWGSNGSTSFYLDVVDSSKFGPAGETGTIVYTASLEVGGVSVLDDSNVIISYSNPTIVAGGNTLGNLPLSGEIPGFSDADFGFGFFNWNQVNYQESDIFNVSGTYTDINGVNYSFNQASNTSSSWASVNTATDNTAVATTQFGNNWNFNLGASDNTANFSTALSSPPVSGTTFLAQVTNSGSSGGMVTTTSVANGQGGNVSQSSWFLATSGTAGNRYYYNNTVTVPGSSSGNSDKVSWYINQHSSGRYGGSQYGNLVYNGSSPNGTVTTTSRSAGQSASTSLMSDAYQRNNNGTQGGGLYTTGSSMTLSYNSQATQQQTYSSGALAANTLQYSNSSVGGGSQTVSNSDNYTTTSLGGVTNGSDAYFNSVQGQSQSSQAGTVNLLTNTSTVNSASLSSGSGLLISGAMQNFQGSDASDSSNNSWYSASQGNTLSYYALSGGFNASGLQTSGSSYTYYASGGNSYQYQLSVNASADCPTSTSTQAVTSSYGSQEADTDWANSNGSVTGLTQANSTSTTTTNNFTSLIGTQTLLKGTAVYNDAAANTDVQTTSQTTNLGVWPSGLQYGSVVSVVGDNSDGSYQINVQTNLNNNVLKATENGGGWDSVQTTNTEVASYANSYLPTTTDTLDTSDSDGSYDTVSSGGSLSDNAGHSGTWTYTTTTTGGLSSQMWISWVQVGNGNWTMTGNWFSQSSSGNSSYAYAEQDNGLGASLMSGESGTFANSQSNSGSTSQSQTAVGTFSIYAFTYQLTSNSTKTTSNSSNTSFAALGTSASTSMSNRTMSSSQVGEVGLQLNGVSVLASLNVNQSVVSTNASDGSSSGPQWQSSGHSRWTSTYTVQMSGNSAAGTGQSQTTTWSAAWGTWTSDGQTTSMGNPSGYITSSPPVNLSWPVKMQSPPPPPPTVNSTETNPLFRIPPIPQSGPGLIEQVEGKLKRNAQYEAMGLTPPPLTSGSSPAYGNGNQTAGQAFADALTLSIQMLSTSSGPFLGLGFNALMTLGSAATGNGQDALAYGSQTYINALQSISALEGVGLLNPCGPATKTLAAYSFYNNVDNMVQNGVTFKGLVVSAYDLGALFFACFTGDMLLRCEGGKKRADAIREGDLLWSRDEHDPDGPLVLKRVLRRFERTAKIWHLCLPGQVLRTTLEHPFWVENRQSWLPVGELHVGDLVRTDAGELLAVEGIEDSGKWERVYNWEVEDYHTYFVSASDNAASIWAHNTANPETCAGAGEEKTPKAVRGTVEVLELAEAKQLRPRNPTNTIDLYHGTNDSGVTGLLGKGIDATTGGGDFFPVTTQPKTAVGYAEKVARLYGGSPKVLKMEIPYEDFSTLFKNKLIEPHEFWPDSYNVSQNGADVLNSILGLPMI